MDEFDFVSAFYYEQQAKINELRKKEDRLLDQAATIRRKMSKLESRSDGSSEWHELQYKLDAIEAQLVQVSEWFENP